MLAKKNKISRINFLSVLKEGSFFYSLNFDFCYKKELSNQKKFSCVISKKIVKKSTTRNLIKRRVYNILRNNLKKIKNGIWIIIFVKKDISKLPYHLVEKEIINFFKKEKLCL